MMVTAGLTPGAVPIHVSTGAKFRINQKVNLALRPEKISLTSKSTGKINEFPVKVIDWAFYGAGTQYRVVGPGGINLKLYESHNLPSKSNARQPETGFINFSPDSIIILER